MIDGGDSSELIKLDIQSEAKGLPSAIDEIVRLQKALERVEATLASGKLNKGLEASWKNSKASLEAQIKKLEELNKVFIKAAEASKATVKAQNASTTAAKENAAAMDKQKASWKAATTEMQRQLAASKMAGNVSAFADGAKKGALAAKAQRQASDAAAKATKNHSDFVAQLNRQIKNSAKEVNMFTNDFNIGTAEGKQNFSAWKKGMDNIGVSIMGSAKNLSLFKKNMLTFKDAVNNTAKAGVANLGTIDALSTGSASAFTRGISGGEKFRIQLGMIKRDAKSLFDTLHLRAKDTQWLGRQMLQGISVPVLGFGAIAVQSFDRVNKSLLQLKKVMQFKGDFDGMKEDIKGVAHEYALATGVVTMLYEDIAAMGVRGNSEIKSWAEGVAQIAQLGDVDLGDATKLFRVMNAVFSESGTAEETKQIMADLNAVVDESSIRLKDLVGVLPTAAPVMKNMGFNASGTAIALTSMYKNGIDANVAAHALSMGMQRFTVPTKQASEAIEQLGVGFFNANGQITDADKNFALMAERFSSFAPADAQEMASKIFGKHHAGKFMTMFEDVAEGLEQLRQANLDGKITMEEVEQFTSDYARTMVASGKVAAEGVVDSATRYNNAWAQFKNDPSMQLARLKNDLKTILIDVGAVIIDPLLKAGEKIKSFFEVLNAMPTFVKRGFGVLLLAAAALGPVIYAFAQLEHSIATFGKLATAVLPKAFKDITELDARSLLEADPTRTDVKQVGSRFLQVDDDKRGSKGPKGAAIIGAKDLGIAEGELATAHKIAEEAAEEQGEALQKLAFKNKFAEREAEKLRNTLLEAAAAQKFLNEMADTGIIPEGAPGAGTKNPKAMNRAKQEAVGSIIMGDIAGEKLTRMSETMGTKNGDGFLKGFYNKLRGAKPQNLGKNLVGDFKEAVDGNKKIFELKTIFKSAAGEAAGLRGIMTGLFAVTTAGGGGAIKAFLGMATSLSGVILVAAPLIAIIGGLIWFVSEARKHFEEIKIAAEPGFKAIGNAVQYVKDALAEVGQKFAGVINQLSGGKEGDQTIGFWQNFGNIVGQVAGFVAKAIKLIGDGIKAAWPLIEGIAYAVKDVIGFVSSLINGEWATAFQYLAAFAWEGTRPVAAALELLSNIALWAVKTIISGFEWLSKGLESLLDSLGITTTAFSGFFASLGDGVQSMADFNLVDYMDGQMRNLAPVFSGGVAKAIPKADDPAAKQAANDLGKGIGTELAESTGETAKKKMAEDGWFKDFLSAVKSRIEQSVQALKEGALKAMDAAHAAEIKVYDDKLKKMDEIEDAETRLYATQAYLEKKKEMLYQRSINTQNYQRDRALAIYEGRIDDARMIDLQQKRDTHDFNKDISGLEDERGKELLKQAREDERARIEAEKQAAQDRFDVQKEAFEKALDLITEYTPRTVEEYNKMMQSINGLLEKNGVHGWPEMAKTGGERMFDAIHKANEDIRQDFAWSGEAAITAWIAAFADADVVDILKKKMQEASDSLSDTPSVASSGLGPEGVDINGTGAAGMGGPGGPSVEEPKAPDFKGADAIGFDFDAMKRDFWNGIEEIKNWFKGLWENVSGWAGTAWDWIADKASGAWSFITDVWGSVSGFFSDLWTGITDGVSGAWEGVTGFFSDLWDGVSGIFVSAWETIGGAIQGAWENIIQPIWDNIINFWNNQLSPIVQFMASIFQTVWWAIGQAISFAWNSIIKPIWDNVGGWITGSLIPWFQNLWNTVSNVWSNISNSVSNAWNQTLSPIFTGISNWISNSLIPWFQNLWAKVGQVWTGISDWISGAWNKIYGIFSHIWSWITDYLVRGWGYLKDGAVTAFNGIVDFLKRAWNTITGGIANGINWLIDRFNNIISVWNMLPDEVHKDVNPVGYISIPPFAMASGGFVTQGVSAIVGEGKRPEFVIPTDPAYRSNALQLTGQLLNQLGQGKTPSMSGASLSKNTSAIAGAASERAGTNIYVDTMIGEEAWFVQKMAKYDVKIAKKKADASGSQRRVVSSYNENQRGSWKG